MKGYLLSDSLHDSIKIKSVKKKTSSITISKMNGSISAKAGQLSSYVPDPQKGYLQNI